LVSKEEPKVEHADSVKEQVVEEVKAKKTAKADAAEGEKPKAKTKTKK